MGLSHDLGFGKLVTPKHGSKRVYVYRTAFISHSNCQTYCISCFGRTVSSLGELDGFDLLKDYAASALVERYWLLSFYIDIISYIYIYIWHTYDIHMIYIWYAYDIHMIYIWYTYDMHMTYIWYTYDIYTYDIHMIYIHMIYIWYIYIWYTYDIHMIYIWYTYDIHMIYIWYTYNVLYFKYMYARMFNTCILLIGSYLVVKGRIVARRVSFLAQVTVTTTTVTETTTTETMLGGTTWRGQKDDVLEVSVLIMHRMWIVDVGAHFQKLFTSISSAPPTPTSARDMVAGGFPGFMTWRFNQPPFQDEPSPKKTRPYVSSYSCQPPLTSKGYYWWVPFRGGLVEFQHDSDIQLPDAIFQLSTEYVLVPQNIYLVQWADMWNSDKQIRHLIYN